MPAQVTLKDLSKILNLSVSTVSKSLNNSPEISFKTRKRVKELAELNNYVPNVAAKNLKKPSRKTIGLVIPSAVSNFYAAVLEGIESEASMQGYKILLHISNESLKKEKTSIYQLIQEQVDGIIMVVSKETQLLNQTEHLKEIQKYSIPLLMFDRILDNFEVDKVSTDHSLHSYLATKFLYKSGYRKIVYFSGIPGTIVNGHRRSGYQKGVSELKIPPHFLEFEMNRFPVLVLEEMAKNNQIDSILASTESCALMAMKHLIKMGFSIPKEIGVMGFANGRIANHFIPALTAIDQQAEKQGKLAFETIMHRIIGKLPSTSQYFKIDATIIHRESTMRC